MSYANAAAVKLGPAASVPHSGSKDKARMHAASLMHTNRSHAMKCRNVHTHASLTLDVQRFPDKQAYMLKAKKHSPYITQKSFPCRVIDGAKYTERSRNTYTHGLRSYDDDRMASAQGW